MVDTAVAMTLRRRIQQRLDLLRLTMRKASLKAGLGTHFVRDLMENELQSPKADNLTKLAIALRQRQSGYWRSEATKALPEYRSWAFWALGRTTNRMKIKEI